MVIVGVSATAIDDEAAARAAGMDGYLVKPVSPRALAGAVGSGGVAHRAGARRREDAEREATGFGTASGCGKNGRTKTTYACVAA